MLIQRLTWAGLRLTAPDEDGHEVTLYLDPLFDPPPRFAPFLGDRVHYAPPGQPAAAVLLTHLHEDHYVPTSLRRVVHESSRVLCPADVTSQVAAGGFAVHGLQVWESTVIGPFKVTAVPAVDGLGDPQVSWLVEADGVRLLHCGDTLWHGYWWAIAERCGPISVAFVPINGAQVDYPWLQPPSGVEAAMTVQQAAVAAHVLRARLAVPIHYGTFHLPPLYVEQDGAEQLFIREAAQRGVKTQVLAPGEELALTAEL